MNRFTCKVTVMLMMMMVVVVAVVVVIVAVMVMITTTTMRQPPRTLCGRALRSPFQRARVRDIAALQRRAAAAAQADADAVVFTPPCAGT
jgi:hypothetical protein